jgi:hypothetical protein
MGSVVENSWEGILQPGETVLWQGRPVTGLSWEDLNWPKGLMGLFFVGFSIFWMILAAQAGGFFWMFGLIFFFIGLRNSVGQILIEPWLRGETVYSLTNRRAFIATRGLIAGMGLKSFVISPRDTVKLIRGRTDSLFFDAEQEFGRQGHSFEIRVGFENLADGSDAHRILAQIVKGER